MKMQVLKRLLILLLLVAPGYFKTTAQVTDDKVEQLMTRRLLTCDEITYNAVSMIPNLYKDHQVDTLEAVLSYWRRNCGMSEPVVTFTILYSIEQGTFKEQLKKNKAEYAADSNTIPNTDYYATNMISYLHWYIKGCNIRNHPKDYSPGNDADYIVAAFGAYYDFLRAYGEKLCRKPGLTPVENFLVHFYAMPDTASFRQLREPTYNGTVLQQEFHKNLGDKTTLNGPNVAAAVGWWTPHGNLAVFGPHPSFSLIAGGRSNRWMYDLDLSARFIKSPKPFYVTNNDTAYPVSHASDYFIGADLGYAMLKTKRHELDALAGIAWEGIDVTLFNSIYNTYPSLNGNVGLGYRIFLGTFHTPNASLHSYLALQAKFNFTNFNNRGGTDLTGNAFVISILYGFYRSDNNYYYIPPEK